MRILIAEDDDRLARAVAAGLRRRGMTVDVALTGDDALDRLVASRYDGVGLERDLPGRRGGARRPAPGPPPAASPRARGGAWRLPRRSSPCLNACSPPTGGRFPPRNCCNECGTRPPTRSPPP